MTLCNCWQRLALFCLPSAPLPHARLFFWPFFGCFFNICAVCPKSRPTLLPLAVGAGKGNAAAAARGSMRQLGCCHTVAATSAATAALAFGTFGRLQLNTRCFRGIVYIVNERLLHIQQERERGKGRGRERRRGRGKVGGLYILMLLSAVCCYCFVHCLPPALLLSLSLLLSLLLLFLLLLPVTVVR